MQPVPYPVTTPYGEPGNWAAGYHTGDDYACPTGTPVVAAAAGKVVACAWDDSYGWYAEIDTDGVRHRYCHLSAKPAVSGTVTQGQRVGSSGSTGNSTGPHLHYEERVAPWTYWDHREPQLNHQTSPKPPQPLEEADAMLLQRKSDKIGVLITGGKAVWVKTGSDYQAMDAGGLPAAVVSDELFGDVIEAMGGAQG